MYGIQIAFRDFRANKGIISSPWAGLKYFEQFFNSYYFERLLRNTLIISVTSLVASFPVAVGFALVLNEIKSIKFKKLVQTVTYAPYFISTVVMVGMILQFLDTRAGLFNNIIEMIGFSRIGFMSESKWFVPIYVLSGLWQNTGYSAIIYLAALSSIDPELYDACKIDGANKFQKVKYVDIPGIMPTIVVMLILSAGNIMNLGFEKIYLMQNSLNLETSQVISTYVYELGLTQARYSNASAIGLFNSVINFILLISVNKIAKHVNGYSLW
jgi:putative aldouronate transport system permease protein